MYNSLSYKIQLERFQGLITLYLFSPALFSLGLCSLILQTCLQENSVCQNFPPLFLKVHIHTITNKIRVIRARLWDCSSGELGLGLNVKDGGNQNWKTRGKMEKVAFTFTPVIDLFSLWDHKYYNGKNNKSSKNRRRKERFTRRSHR